MSQPLFRKATREKVFLKLAITGPSGSGKTYSALRLARGLVGPSGKIAPIDTENRSASLYADRFDFDSLEIAPPFDNEKFVDGVSAAVEAKYGAIVIDSASHFWEGILDYKDKLDQRGGNSYTNWKIAGEKFGGVIKAVLQSPTHVICCMRSKMDYVQEKDDRGKTQIKKVGLAPIMRDGIEYEFTTVFDVALNHQAAVSKDRSGLFVDKIFQIAEETGAQLEAWRLSGGEPLWKVQLTTAIGAHEFKANAFLVTLGWIKDGQTFRDLSVTNAEKVLANSVAFLAKVNA
ncbi:MAG: ATP-binding protein [Verrucomicrobia bacterium]|nr:ATP-binding protein [Verrucomicrobiota bacterium]